MSSTKEMVAADDYGGYVDDDDDEEEEPFNERKWFDYGGRCWQLGLARPSAWCHLQ